MAGAKRPAPHCSHNNPVNVEDGTLCRASSPVPGPVGAAAADTSFSAGMHTFLLRGECLVAASVRAVALSPAAVVQETGYELGGLLKGLFPGLLTMIVGVGGTTAAGAVVGGVFGSAPGAVVGGELGFDAGMAILTWLGIAFLLESIGSGLGEMAAMVWIGTQHAWHAAERRGADREREIGTAAHELAKAVGILIRLLLEGIVAYLLKKPAMSSTRGVIRTARAVRSAGAEAVADETVAALVSKLRASQLGDGFATWVEKNWKDLVKNPRLRPKALAGGGGALAAEAESSAKPSKAPKRPEEPPAAESPKGFIDGEVPASQREKVATDWYAQQPGATIETAASRASGFDPSKPMEIKTLQPGTKIAQWVRSDGKPGIDFTTPDADPATLGLPMDPETGFPKGRSLQVFEVNKPLQVLQGTARTFPEGPFDLVGGQGGGPQIAMPPGWQSSLKPVPGP